jgi:hypothetical protein
MEGLLFCGKPQKPAAVSKKGEWIMKFVNNERGVALVTSLLLTLISLAIILSLLYLITQGIQVSGSSKRYKSALEASYASVDVLAKEIIPQLLNGSSPTQLETSFSVIGLDFGSYPNCLNQKMNNATNAWTSGVCGPNPNAINPKSNYDSKFTLKGLPLQGNYTVYTQIIATVKGNSDMSGNELLESGSGVTGSSAGISPMHVPSMYTIEVQGEKEINPSENARLSVLYAY